jgi:KDO2-lipid IV(A) lauroyltransferase
VRWLANHIGVGALRYMQAFARAWPPRGIATVAWIAGTLWWAYDGRRRRRARENLRTAFGPEPDRRTLSRRTVRVFRNMVRVSIEVMWFDRLLASPAQVERRCTFSGPWRRGEPACVMFTGHVGNWEAIPRAVRHRSGPIRPVVRRIPNPAVDAWANRMRGGSDGVIFKHGAYRDLVRSLRDGYHVLIVGDQNAGLRGLFVPFFGVPASTWETPARLALREGAPLDLVVVLRRPGPDIQFEVHRERLAHAAPPGRRPDAVHALTATAHARLEAWVRRAPEQYNFLHRRWKDRPPGEASGAPVPQYDHHARD